MHTLGSAAAMFVPMHGQVQHDMASHVKTLGAMLSIATLLLVYGNLRQLRCRAVAVGGRRSRFVELVQRAGNRPSTTDAEAFSFWIASLIPLNSSDKYRLLSMTSSNDRLEFEHEKLKGSSPGVCSIM